MMTADLTRFLVGYAARPFRWGQDDCSLILADWWRDNHGGYDPAHLLRGRYSDALGKARLVARHGGLLELVSGLAAQVGATETQTPERGDFGLIYAGDEPVGGIMSTQSYWAFRNEQIGFILKPRIVRAWKI